MCCALRDIFFTLKALLLEDDRVADSGMKKFRMNWNFISISPACQQRPQ